MIAITSVGPTHSPGAPASQAKHPERGDKGERASQNHCHVPKKKLENPCCGLTHILLDATGPIILLATDRPSHLLYLRIASSALAGSGSGSALSFFFLSLSLALARSSPIAKRMGNFGKCFARRAWGRIWVAPSAVSKTPPPIFVQNPAHLAIRTSVILLVRNP